MLQRRAPHIAALLAVAAAGLALISQDEVASLRAKARSALSQTAGERRVPGLKQAVEVIRDRWGSCPLSRPQATDRRP